MSSIDFDPELAAALERLVPLDAGVVADWPAVLDLLNDERAKGHARLLPRGRRLRLAVIVAAIVFVLASVATATFLVLRSSGTTTAGIAIVRDASGRTIGRSDQRIVVIDPSGRQRTVWHCPGHTFCGLVVSLDWAPDGHRLAISLDELGGQSTYVGLHVIDTATGSDKRVPRLEAKTPLQKIARMNIKTFGCVSPYQLDWSSDGLRLAYVCPTPHLTPPGRIYLIRADGTGRTLVHTGGTATVSSPSWSPDGRIAYELKRKGRRPAMYVVDPRRGAPRLLAEDASSPAWSPDGSSIAFNSLRPGCLGVRLINLSGADTPPWANDCSVVGPRGTPVWSPDGRELAIGALDGVYAVQPNGTGLRRITRQTGVGLYGTARPSWTPTTGINKKSPAPNTKACATPNCY